MKKTLFLLMALFVVSLLGNATQAYGMEMSEEQKEVWEMIKTAWENLKKGDVDGLRKNNIDSSLEWWSNKTIPLGWNTMELNYRGWLGYEKPVSYELEPLAIHIVGDVANVFYLWEWKGKKISDRGRHMSTWVKIDNNWRFMGGMDASCDRLPPCGK